MFVQPDVPPEAIVSAPVEFPMLVAAVPVALILVAPVTVKPPVPCIKPVPELTPTTTSAPDVFRDELVNEKIFVPAVVPEISVSQPVPI